MSRSSVGHCGTARLGALVSLVCPDRDIGRPYTSTLSFSETSRAAGYSQLGSVVRARQGSVGFTLGAGRGSGRAVVRRCAAVCGQGSRYGSEGRAQGRAGQGTGQVVIAQYTLPTRAVVRRASKEALTQKGPVVGGGRGTVSGGGRDKICTLTCSTVCTECTDYTILDRTNCADNSSRNNGAITQPRPRTAREMAWTYKLQQACCGARPIHATTCSSPLFVAPPPPSSGSRAALHEDGRLPRSVGGSAITHEREVWAHCPAAASAAEGVYSRNRPPRGVHAHAFINYRRMHQLAPGARGTRGTRPRPPRCRQAASSATRRAAAAAGRGTVPSR